MRIPALNFSLETWPEPVLDRWKERTEKVSKARESVGHNSRFDQMLRAIREMLRRRNLKGLIEIISSRPGARALCWLWLEDSKARQELLSPGFLDRFVALQKPRLSRMSLLYLVSLYFKYFDHLDASGQGKVRERLQALILEQLTKLPTSKSIGARPDPLHSLQQDGHWLLEPDGPLRVAMRTKEAGQELDQALVALGLSGMDTGRYGDICRAHFYLNTLKELPLGQWDPVLEELLKPAVSKAPYKGSVRVGHAALSILIDRASADPGECWQSWILSLAGDPRISSRARSYREWWRPLGEARIQKVRSWLHKEDLRLFLRALEQYGIESRKPDIQRMFPARKVFLEGLDRLGLIRHSRLMLGRTAQTVVRRILDKDMLTSFAHLGGSMADKAVIYLDCGDFCLVEGSHSFKIWVYLAPPSPLLMSYETGEFSHTDLTVKVPEDYEGQFPDYYYCSVVHNGPWQWRVFDFLADNGIQLDLEQLLTRADYQHMLRHQGLPVAKPSSVRALQDRRKNMIQAHSRVEGPDILAGQAADCEAATQGVMPGSGDSDRLVPAQDTPMGSVTPPPLAMVPANDGSSFDATLRSVRERILGLSTEDWYVLLFVHRHPNELAREIAVSLDMKRQGVNRILHGKLREFVEYDSQYRWRLRDVASTVMEQIGE